MTDTEEKQVRPFWLLAVLSIITIIFWIITICSPSIFWKFMDIILWFFLIMTWISAIINTVKNQNTQFIRLLLVFWILITILWFLLVFSRSQFVGTLMVWIFAIWAILRWIILIFFSLSNKNTQKFWWAILWLWILLLILWIVIIFSSTSEARNLAWICIWISTVLDWVILLIFSFRVKDNPWLQAEILKKSEENEIAQWNVVITETTVVTEVNTQPIQETQQPTPEAQQPNNENPA